MQATVEGPPQTWYRSVGLAVLSAAVPGLGDWAGGDRRRGAWFMVLFAVLLLFYWPLRLPGYWWAYAALRPAGLALNGISSWCAFFARGRARRAVAGLWSLWVIAPLAVVPFAVKVEQQVALYAAGFQVFGVYGESMAPTLDFGDAMIVDRWEYRGRGPRTGEVIVFRHHGSNIVKRAIALSGSMVQANGGRIALDGSAIAEPYAVHRKPGNEPSEEDNFAPVRVPEKQLYVMGDNRDFCQDSRMHTGPDAYGPVYMSDVIGRVLYRFRTEESFAYRVEKIR